MKAQVKVISLEVYRWRRYAQDMQKERAIRLAEMYVQTKKEDGKDDESKHAKNDY